MLIEYVVEKYVNMADFSFGLVACFFDRPG